MWSCPSSTTAGNVDRWAGLSLGFPEVSGFNFPHHWSFRQLQPLPFFQKVM